MRVVLQNCWLFILTANDSNVNTRCIMNTWTLNPRRFDGSPKVLTNARNPLANEKRQYCVRQRHMNAIRWWIDWASCCKWNSRPTAVFALATQIETAAILRWSRYTLLELNTYSTERRESREQHDGDDAGPYGLAVLPVALRMALLLLNRCLQAHFKRFFALRHACFQGWHTLAVQSFIKTGLIKTKHKLISLCTPTLCQHYHYQRKHTSIMPLSDAGMGSLELKLFDSSRVDRHLPQGTKHVMFV